MADRKQKTKVSPPTTFNKSLMSQTFAPESEQLGIPASTTGDPELDRDKHVRQYPLELIPQSGYIKDILGAWLNKQLPQPQGPSLTGAPLSPIRGYVWGRDDDEFNIPGSVPLKYPGLLGLQTSTALGSIHNDPYALGILGHEMTHTYQNRTEGVDPIRTIQQFPGILDKALSVDERGQQTAYTKDSSPRELQAEIFGHLIKNLMSVKQQEDQQQILAPLLRPH